jgi:signal transduction histidine kinase
LKNDTVIEFLRKTVFSKFRLSGLNTQLFLIAVLPISLLLIAVTFGSMAIHQDAMRILVGQRDQRTVRSAASALQKHLNHRASAIHGLALRTEDNSSLVGILESVDYLSPDFDFGMAFYSPEGNLLASRGDIVYWETLDSILSDEIAGYFNEDITYPYFSEAFIHPQIDDYFATVVSQSEQGAPLAVGIFSVTNLARQTLASAIEYKDETSILLVDKRGQLLYRVGDLHLSETPISHPGVREALAGESGASYLKINGNEHVIAFDQVSPTGWALIIEESWDTVASPSLRYTEAGSLVLVPIVVFSLIALWFTANRIIQPLKSLETQSAALALGDFEAVKNPVGGIAEIKNLQRTLIDLSEKVQNAQQNLHNYIGSITQGQEDERRRLARDLHDETLQSLIALNQRVQIVQRIASDDQTRKALKEIQDLISQSMQELRRLTQALRPLYLEDLGLVAALEMFAQETSEAAGFPVHFTHHGAESRLPDNTEIAIYRIVQEALSNINRHARANRAKISLSYETNDVILSITDDGEGFEIPEALSELSREGHFGLLGIYERTELIGANIEIHSNIGGGTQLVIQIPK